MGVPFNDTQVEDDLPVSQETTSSSSEEINENEEGSEEEEEDPHYTFSSDDDSAEWEDPSEGGILTLVFRAAELGDDSELDQLLQSLNVDIDTPGPDRDTALHLAALYGHLECARILIEKGHSAACKDDEHAIPLHDAAAGGYLALCEILLDAAPDCINCSDIDGDTPLHNAARGGSLDVVQLLLRRGASPLKTNNDFKTPVDLATPLGSEIHTVLLNAADEYSQDDTRE